MNVLPSFVPSVCLEEGFTRRSINSIGCHYKGQNDNRALEADRRTGIQTERRTDRKTDGRRQTFTPNRRKFVDIHYESRVRLFGRWLQHLATTYHATNQHLRQQHSPQLPYPACCCCSLLEAEVQLPMI